jgi:hypothetical protein
MIDGARKKGWGSDSNTQEQIQSHIQPKPVFNLIRVGNLDFRDPEYLVDGLIETSSIAQIFGDPGAGKSFLALDVAACVATGKPFHGHEVRQGTVIYIAGEGHNGIRRRLAAWEINNSVSLITAPLFLSTTAAQFHDNASAKTVVDAVDEIALNNGKPVLILLDTFARNFGDGDENSAKDVSAFIQQMDFLKERYRCSIIIVHHTGHSEKNRARGSIALTAAVDIEFKATMDKGIISLSNKKMKDAAPPTDLCFRLQSIDLGTSDDGAAITSAVLVSVNSRPQEKDLTKNQRIAMSSYIAAAKLNGQLNEDETFEGIHINDWRKEFYKMKSGSKKDTAKHAFDDSKKALIERGDISFDERSQIYTLAGPNAARLQKDIEAALGTSSNIQNIGEQFPEREAGGSGKSAGKIPLVPTNIAGGTGRRSIDLPDLPHRASYGLIAKGYKGHGCGAH